MKKKKYIFSRMTIISLFILFLSICGTAACIVKIHAYRHALPPEHFSENNLKPGKYISGTITSYVISPRKPKGSGTYDYFGVWNNFTEQYFGYLIPLNEEQYIRIWVKDPETLALLNETSDGFSINVPFTGRIEAWEDWSDSPYSDETLGFDHNKVITGYVIVQKNLTAEMFLIKVCLAGIMIALLLYRFKGKIEVSEAVYEDKTQKSQNIPQYADISAEITIIERHLRKYEELEKEYRTWGLIGAVCIAAGVFLFVTFGSFSALVIFILLSCYGIKHLWTYFINSQNRIAVFLADLFHIKTLRIERMEEYKLLAALKEKKIEKKSR